MIPTMTNQQQMIANKFHLRELEKTELARHYSKIPFTFEMTVNVNLPCSIDYIQSRIDRLDTHLNLRQRKNSRCFIVALTEKCQSQDTHFHSLLYLPPNYLKNSTDFEFIKSLKQQIVKLFPSANSASSIEVKRICFPKSFDNLLLHDLPYRQYREHYFRYPYKKNENFDSEFFRNPEDMMRYVPSHSSRLTLNEPITQYYESMSDKYFQSQVANRIPDFPKTIHRIEIESRKIQELEDSEPKMMPTVKQSKKKTILIKKSQNRYENLQRCYE